MDEQETGTIRQSSKVHAILVAVFFGHWTWLYTYHQDKWKFWGSLILILVALIIAVTLLLAWSTTDLPSDGVLTLFPILPLLLSFLVFHDVCSGAISFFLTSLPVFLAEGSEFESHLIYFFVLLLLAAVWVWAIIDSAVKPKTRYESEPAERSKKIALILAILFNYRAWLYTCHKDVWKFWVSFGIVTICVPACYALIFFIFLFAGEQVTVYVLMGLLMVVGPISLGTIWLLAIIDNLPMRKKWINFKTQAQQEEAPS